MTNYEKYQKEIIGVIKEGYGVAYINGAICKCHHNCLQCAFANEKYQCKVSYGEWLESEYVEPPVDWSKVEVDTKVLVKQYREKEWKRRYFSGQTVVGVPIMFKDGKTSWTTEETETWEETKLYEEGEQNE